MKKLKTTLLALIFSLACLLSSYTNVYAVSENDIEESLEVEETLSTESDEGITGFVTRLYSVCLDRTPDEEGLNYWIDLLKSGNETGIHTASGFIFSKEFQNKNLCNDDYVEYLYKAFMGRNSDAEGKAYWINELENGKSREVVFNGFALSQEFNQLCKDYGIVVGIRIDEPDYGTLSKGKCTLCGAESGVTTFLIRMYKVCLDRVPDEDGLNYWSEFLWNHEKSGSEIAEGFIFSPEFQGKNLDNADYVEYMYKAFFDRPSDAEGKTHWVSKLNQGENREYIFNGFVGSEEFKKLCLKAGIQPQESGCSHNWVVETQKIWIEETGHYEKVQEPYTDYEITRREYIVCQACQGRFPDMDAFGDHVYENQRQIEITGEFGPCAGSGCMIYPDNIKTPVTKYREVVKWITEIQGHYEYKPTGKTYCSKCGNIK